MADGVLLTCHGTVSDLRDMAAFLTNVRRGRPASDEFVREITRRYEAIGGSPLMDHTRAQARALEARLDLPVRIAGRLWQPYAREALADLAGEGVTRVLSLPLAPQSVHVYNASVMEALDPVLGLEVVAAPPWGTEPALIDALVETVDEAISEEAREGRPVDPARAPVILTAHSLPMRVLQSGDPYETDFREMAGAVVRRLEERGHPTSIAFQSQGATSEAWLGPDLPEAFSALAARGFTTVVVAPIGFCAEHVETLYDLDIEAPELARARGLTRLVRARAVGVTRGGEGSRSRFIDALEAVARRCLGAATDPSSAR